jgi:Tfp pilus assembly protein PilN
MAQSINLVPQEEVFEQTKSKVVRFSTILSIFLLVVIGGIGYYLVGQKFSLQKQLKNLDSEIEQLRTDITNLSSIEVTARTLDKRYKVLSDIVYSRHQYSLLLSELAARTPPTVDVLSFSIKDDVANISGESTDYLSIADFTNTMIDGNFTGGDQDLQKLFTSAVLQSVTLSSKDGVVKFVLNVSFDGELLKR